MPVTYADLKRWKKNSLELAKKLGYKKEILGFMENKVELRLLSGMPKGRHLIYGHTNIARSKYAEYYTVMVYALNISCLPEEALVKVLKSMKVPPVKIDYMIKTINKIGKKKFFEIFGQSGMDHELMGHAYHIIERNDNSERTALNVQIKFAKARASGVLEREWGIALKLMIEFFKFLTIARRV